MPDSRGETLTLLSCPEWKACTAIGTYRRPNSTSKLPVVLSQVGDTWIAQRPAFPASVSAPDTVTGTFDTLICTHVRDCLAAGVFGRAGALIETESNGTWKARSAQLPSGARGKIENFTGAACPSTSRCLIIGNYSTAAYGSSHGFLLTQSPAGWMAEKIPLPVSPPWSLVSKLSCQTASVCFIGGGYGLQPSPPETGSASKDAISSYRAFLLRLDGTSWKISFVGQNYTGPVWASALSCSADKGCAGAFGANLVFGAKIQAISSLVNSKGYNAELIHAFACSVSECFAAGQELATNQSFPLLASSGGSKWRRTPLELGALDGVPEPVQLDQVSCASSSWCEATGKIGWNGSEIEPLVTATFSSGKWTAQQLSLSKFWQATIAGVSCPRPRDCSAVGYFATSTTPSGLILHDRSGKWQVFHPPVPSDTMKLGTVQLTGISCGSPKICVAVGTYQGPHTQEGLILDDDNGHWKAMKAPLPAVSDAWGKDVFISTVTCGFTAHCVAIGGYETDGSVSGSLIWSMTNGAWTAVNPPPSPSARYPNLSFMRLTAVSCPARGGSCGVTGNFYTGNQDQQHVLLLHGYGRNWQFTEIPVDHKNFSSANLVFPQAISCVDSGWCIVGANQQSYRPEQPSSLAAFVFTDGKWKIGQIPNPNNADLTGHPALSALACISRNSCAAVGGYPQPEQPMVLTLGDGRWTAEKAPLPIGSLNAAEFTNVAVAGSRYVALGFCSGSDLDSLQGLVEMSRQVARSKHVGVVVYWLLAVGPPARDTRNRNERLVSGSGQFFMP